MVGFLFELLAFLAAVGAAFGGLAAVTMLLARLTVGSFVFGWTGVNLSCQALSEIGCRLGQLGLTALTLLARHSFWVMLPFGKMLSGLLDTDALADNRAALADALRAQARLEAQAETAREEAARLLSALQALDAECRNLRKQLSAAGADKLYRRVGLSSTCPDWFISIARREWRKRLHPDGHTDANKEEATRRFQAAEMTFDAILEARSCRTR